MKEKSELLTDEELADINGNIDMPSMTDVLNLSRTEQKYEALCIRFGMLLDRYRRVKSSNSTRGVDIAKKQAIISELRKVLDKYEPREKV